MTRRNPVAEIQSLRQQLRARAEHHESTNEVFGRLKLKLVDQLKRELRAEKRERQGRAA